MKKLLYMALLLPALIFGQSTGQNYIRTRTYKKASTESGFDINNPAHLATNVIYFDGLGRPIQQIAHKQSETGTDIVTPVVYDAHGRQLLEYLPYASQTASMDYNTSAVANVLGFYNTTAYENTTNPYSEKRLEASPLGRVLEQGAPGLDWVVNPASDTDHTIKFGYQANVASEVKLFKATAAWDGASIALVNGAGTTFYPAGQLYKTITKDENWIPVPPNTKNGTVEEFKNKKGQVVLKRTYENNNALDTYYIYDQFGNLAYVAPPLATGNISAKLDALCYQYKYDKRNRLIEKKLPGKQWEFIVYDKLDRVVATGPANSPFTNTGGSGWLITKYDVLSRPVLTGWVASSTVTSAGRNSLQTTINGLSVINEARTAGSVTINSIPFNYSTTAWPTSNYHVLTVNYYDDYLYTGAPTSFSVMLDTEQVYYNNSTQKPKGLPTGSWIRVLTTTTSTVGETSHTLYDRQARPTRIYTTNHLGGFTSMDNKFDFEGKVLYTITSHKRLAGSPEVKTREDFAYTDQGRLLTHTHKINNATSAELMAKSEYDALGQLKVKRVGGAPTGAGLQKVDYTYNIRGWLKGINNTGNLAEGGTIPVDLFAFKLNYNTVEAPNATGTALYNGNISETYWKTYPENGLRKYSYEYDALNRLTDAVYVKPGLMNPVTNSYNEEMGYDSNGNITYLNRNGYLDGENGQVYEIDHLSYIYDPDTNVLRRVDDLSNSLDGFRDGGNLDADYFYDGNGNMTGDLNKGIDQGGILYNHLNLPTRINFQVTQGQKFIEYIYNAIGVKVGKRVLNESPGGNEYSFTDYLGGFQYVNDVLQFFPTAEGYVSVTNGDRFNYVYNYTDHLGNIRLGYTDDGGQLKTLEESHYYPFGMKHSYNREIREWGGNPETGIFAILREVERNKYQYKYQGQERQDELGLNWDSFKWRNYDYAIARFMSIDPLTEEYEDYTPYQFSSNQPVHAKELEGLESSDDLNKSKDNAEKADPDSFRGKVVSFLLDVSLSMGDLGATVNGTEANTIEEKTGHIGTGFLFLVDNSLFIEGIMSINRAPSNGETKVSYSKGSTTTTAKSGTGIIYKVPGEATKSGKPYIGRTSKSSPAERGKGATDGRDRTKATVIDRYDTKKAKEGSFREQRAINNNGGVKKLDNKRNEMSEKKYKDYQKKNRNAN